MRFFVGIDPGFGTRGKEAETGGALVAINSVREIVWTLSGYLSEADMARGLFSFFTRDLTDAWALMEDAPGFVGMNVKAIGGLNRSAGAFRALFAQRSIPLDEIAPRKWPPLLGIALPQPFSVKRLGAMDKKQRAARARRQKAEYVRRKEDMARRLWPNNPEIALHPGLRDAALIAEVLRRREVGAAGVRDVGEEALP